MVRDTAKIRISEPRFFQVTVAQTGSCVNSANQEIRTNRFLCRFMFS